MPHTIRNPTVAAEQHRELIEEFHALIAKHPEAEGKFVLAHLPEGPREHSPETPPIVWECEPTDFGLDCRPVILEVEPRC
ncbi:hypothetical protein BJY24_007369 [Nocardia transvalensis]|uniref:Uncharacterized protein n=1 Tax=Nocardia transvalensis TaxID=37333 RepID=A0A7W9PLP6_9NOCA|nr:hypothetical protein [Nocardia transvalensis]MBB5918457.1 hypothetical protein [Nocardia transvalensis]